MKYKIALIALALTIAGFTIWKIKYAEPDCEQQMVDMLAVLREKSSETANMYDAHGKLKFVDSLLSVPHSTESNIRYCKYLKANILLELGEEEEGRVLLESLANTTHLAESPNVYKSLAMAFLRQGERTNCLDNHAAESCILPIQGLGIHQNPFGSEKAIGIFTDLLKSNPDDLESRWLLNIAYMTLGKYPKEVPAPYFIPGMEGDTTYKIKPFEDIAGSLQLNLNNMAGGSITEDFDNDGYIDIMTSSWGHEEPIHLFKNNSNGTFTDLSDKIGLKGINGGLNILQADYNNDGNVDVLVLRGAWRMENGKDPNSLLRNNGDGTFTDVTTQSGLLSFHPTQTATWNDFNNDGWLDLFIGNESEGDTPLSVAQGRVVPLHPCELYINNGDGTFHEVAKKANCAFTNFVKGVTSGDYNNDGWQDIFLSTMDRKRILLRNTGSRDLKFEDVTSKAHLDKTFGRTFPTWFWDYNNDGWLDIFTCDYTFEKSFAYYAAAEKLGILAGNPDKTLLYRNNHDGTFTNVAEEAGLNKNIFAMGSNFGDIDNDGFLDMYLGTGNPQYQSLIPNKMFRNIGGEKFADVTSSGRVGHLQKGHGVSFADLDNDGDQDIYIEMGGAFPGDTYQNSFFLNPGYDNNWINLKLEGTKSNRSAIGSRIKLTFRDNGVVRNVYRDVNSGGSFGSSPLRREIGVGKAEVIDRIEITWHGSNTVQVIENIRTNQFLKITEGTDKPERVELKTFQWVLPDILCLPVELARKSNL